MEHFVFPPEQVPCPLFSFFNFTSSPVHGAGSDKILFSAPAPDDESERRQHLLNIPRLRQFHIPSLLSLPGKTKTQGPRTAMIKVNGNLAPASIKYLDKKRSHNYCHDHCDIFLHVVTNDSHTSLWVDLHTRLELNIKWHKITTGIYSEKRHRPGGRRCWGCPGRSPRCRWGSRSPGPSARPGRRWCWPSPGMTGSRNTPAMTTQWCSVNCEMRENK